jgi:flagellum-specific peptidoglycan hydrolase FlgJ
MSPKRTHYLTEKDYITTYKVKAITEMRIFRIPASIILAQALVESAAGTSELAIHANNHFGIKCKEEWWGETYLHTDDLKDECFRKYTSPEDSYRDHSVFLIQRKRYDKLFKLDIKDYRGWANGLSTCGYATDPNYAAKLIEKIELHDLCKLDK